LRFFAHYLAQTFVANYLITRYSGFWRISHHKQWVFYALTK